MKPRDLSLSALLLALAQLETRADDLLQLEFIGRWESAFAVPGLPAHLDELPMRIENRFALWTRAFSQIRFRGMSEVQILLAWGAQMTQETANVVRQLIQPGRTPILLVPAAAAAAQWRQRLPVHAILILGPEEIESILSAEHSPTALRREFRRRIPLGKLDPFDYQSPAVGNMFCGRENELRQLKESDSHSFAIAGPGRIGKTSLAYAYEAELIRDRDPRIHRVRKIDCLNMNAATSETALVRFIAGEIEPSRRASQMMVDDFSAFLKFQRHHLGGPLELIIDEVDGVCQSSVFTMLAEAAKLGHCRLILCGKANLLHHMLAGKSPLAMRLKLIRPEPLYREEARQLFAMPLRDLDIAVETSAMEMVLNLTGCLPHQLQFYASQFLSTVPRNGGLKPVTVPDLESIRDSFISQEFLRAALNELDTVAKALGLLVLESPPHAVSVPSMQHLAQRHGLTLEAEKAMECLISLHIHNFLALERGDYRIATGSLLASAQRHGFLKADLKDAIDAWRQCPALGRSTSSS